jgi:hypothetical protein
MLTRLPPRGRPAPLDGAGVPAVGLSGALALQRSEEAAPTGVGTPLAARLCEERGPHSVCRKFRGLYTCTCNHGLNKVT